MHELRCSSGRLHGTLDDDTIEVSCRSKECGKAEGVLVLHKFNTTTGKLISTSRFQQPEKEVNPNGN